ncbi:hypothetical protein [Streptomyces sp. C10-9-1]|uniref:hypothetical protein n=1 Tax=Streptomyces sp. C10-9-1 TaxID=1859285 RepID=UPI003F4A6ED6
MTAPTHIGPARMHALRAHAARNATPQARAIADLLAEVERLRTPAVPNPLTESETRAVLAIAQSETTEGAAERTGRSVDTIRTQLRRARQRAGVASTHQLVGLAFANGWLLRADLNSHLTPTEDR